MIDLQPEKKRSWHAPTDTGWVCSGVLGLELRHDEGELAEHPTERRATRSINCELRLGNPTAISIARGERGIAESTGHRRQR